MDDEAMLKLGRPVFATEREADLFALANHYRQIIERVIQRGARQRVLYSDGLLRDLGIEMMQAPAPELLHYQPQPVSMAPRDGHPVVLAVAGNPDIAVARYEPRHVHNWRDAWGGAFVTPIAWFPLDQSSIEEAANG